MAYEDAIAIATGTDPAEWVHEGSEVTTVHTYRNKSTGVVFLVKEEDGGTDFTLEPQDDE